MNLAALLKLRTRRRHAPWEAAGGLNRPRAAGRIIDVVVRSCMLLIARYESLARRRPLIFSALTVGLLFGAVFLVFAPGFDTNDDPVMNMIVAGRGCSLAPDEHMIFTNVLLGFALKTVYGWFPSFPWYGVYLLAVNFAAHTVGLFCTIHDGYTRLRLRLYLCYFFVMGVVLLNNLQFTSASFLAGQAGILLLMLALRGPAGAAVRSKQTLALSIAFLLLASLIRREVFYPVLALGFVAAAVCIWFSGNRRMQLVRAATVLLASLAAATAAWKFNDAYYDQDPAWREFYAYNKARIKFNDEAWVYYAPETEHVFDEVKWSKTDFAMLMSWFYDNEELYSLEAFQHIVDGYPWQRARITADTVWKGISTVFADRYSLAVLVVMPLVVFYLEPKGRNYALVASAVAAVCGMTLVVIVFQKTPPARVYLPILAFPLALGVSLAQKSSSLLPVACLRTKLRLAIDLPNAGTRSLEMGFGGKFVCALLALLCIGLFEVNYLQYRRSRERLKTSQQLYEHIATLQPSEDKLFVCWAAAFPYEALRPFASVQVPSKLRLLPMGWPQRTPHYRAMKEHFGIGDLAEAIYRRQDLHVIGDPYSYDLYQDYVLEHFGAEVECELRRDTSLFAVMQASAVPYEDRSIEHLARPPNRNGRSR